MRYVHDGREAVPTTVADFQRLSKIPFASLKSPSLNDLDRAPSSSMDDLLEPDTFYITHSSNNKAL
jgi:hypothetical protein